MIPPSEFESRADREDALARRYHDAVTDTGERRDVSLSQPELDRQASGARQLYFAMLRLRRIAGR